jgi:hypothetical protein
MNHPHKGKQQSNAVTQADDAAPEQAVDDLAITSEGGAVGAIALPEDFPESLPPFSFKLGDRVRWKPMPSTDWGTIAGIEYSWHSPGNSWQPRYKVHLDSDSPSRAWIVEDWAWEWDLEMLEATLR